LADKSGVLRSPSHRLLALRNIPRSQSKNVMQLELKGLTAAPRSLYRASAELFRELERFHAFGTSTSVGDLTIGSGETISVFTNEFWTSKQRAASSLHEVSYRACFKPQLPRFFIERLTQPGDLVYDPFMGRGTTLLEAVLLGRQAAGCDINPLSDILLRPRLEAPSIEQVQRRLDEVKSDYDGPLPEDFLVFYHPKTLRQICALREALRHSRSSVDRWILMVATNRLTGHSKGFFSVYTLPPNQAVSIQSQRRINEQRKQAPEARDVAALIRRKSRSLLSKVSACDRNMLFTWGPKSILMTGSCDETPAIPDESVTLVVTSPPFLDVVDYETDNWLRCWFNHVDPKSIKLWMFKRVEEWSQRMTIVFHELNRVLKRDGFVAFEVGEVRNGKLRLEDFVIPAAEQAGLKPVLVLVNQQEFTKTSNCWGVSNMSKGTNTNRVVLLQKQ
jgi:DNA modification methylase